VISIRVWIFVARAHRLFLFKIKKCHFQVSKNYVKILGVGNVVFYKCGKFQFQILYIQGSIKMINLTYFEVLKVCIVHYVCTDPIIRYFELNFARV
jgi:hypothetical protein